MPNTFLIVDLIVILQLQKLSQEKEETVVRDSVRILWRILKSRIAYDYQLGINYIIPNKLCELHKRKTYTHFERYTNFCLSCS